MVSIKQVIGTEENVSKGSTLASPHILDPPHGALKVFVTSCETGDGAWRGHEVKLKELHGLSDQRHQLVEDAESADIILLGDAREEERGRRILANPLLRKWPEKCFSLCDQDHPVLVNRGVYSSASKMLFGFGRMRAGIYAAYPDVFQNPFVLNHSFDTARPVRKRFLFSFVGRNSHSCRARLFGMRFERSDVLINDSSAFDLWHGDRSSTAHSARQKYYYDILLASKFAICPRGAGTGSLRLLECLRLGIAPVIISDEWVFPAGPDWKRFALVVRCREIDRIEEKIVECEPRHAEMGWAARQAYEDYFSETSYFNFVIENCRSMLERQWIRERYFIAAFPVLSRLEAVGRRVRRVAGRV